MSTGKKAARVGAAAFALGLCLAGPQAGSAAADTQDDASSTSAADSKATPSRASGPSRAGISRSEDSARTRGAGPVRGRAAAPAPEAPAASPIDLDPPSPPIGVAPSTPAATPVVVDPPAPAAALRAPRATATVEAGGAGGSANPATTSDADQPASAVSKPRPADSVAIPVDPAPSVDSAEDAGAEVEVTAVAVTVDTEVPTGAATPLALPTLYSGVQTPSKLLMASAPVAAKPLDKLHSDVQSLFTKVTHFLADLQQNSGPLAPLAANLEGALLLVRKTFFNHAPTLNAVQRTTTPAGLVLGTVGGYDAEGDAISYTVTAKPQFGTLELSTNGKYVYKPGAGYTGSDSVTVKAVSDGSGINLFNLLQGRGQSTEVTIKVGADGPTHPLSGTLGSGAPVAGSTPPLGLFLNAPVSINVDSNNTPTVTLTVRGDTEMTWQRPGANGQITVADAWKSWDTFSTAAGDPKYVMMGVEFTLPNGTQETAIFNSITASGNGDTYTFNGQFATNPADSTGTDGIDTFYDLIGVSYKDSYENFRSRYGGEDDATGKPFNAAGLDLDINSAQVYFSNYTLESYRQALAGTNPGVSVSAPQPGLQSAASTSKRGTSEDITATVADGAGGFFYSTGKGVVTHYRATPPEGEVAALDLTSGIFWNSPVTAMISYQDGLVVGLGDGAIQQWTPGDPTDSSQAKGSWKELQGQGWGSAVNVLMPYKGRPDVCAGGCDGFLVGLNNGSVQQYNEARNGAGQPGWYELQGSGWNSPVRNIVLSKTDSSGLPTFAVGLANGAVEQWNNGPTYGWTEVQKPGKNGWNTSLTAMMPYADGYIVGLDNGAVFQRNNDNDTWKQLQGTGWGSSVRTLVPYGAGFAVGLANGAVEHWTGTGWKEFQAPNYAVQTMSQYGSIGLAVGTGQCSDNCSGGQNQNGVIVWDGDEWEVLQKVPGDTGSGWNGTPTTMMQVGNKLIVGLSDGAVEVWDGTGWTALKSNRLSLADGVLRDAVEYAKTGGKALADGAFIADDANIFYAQKDFLQPACVSSTKGCDASFYPFTLRGENPYSLAGKSIALGDAGQSLDLSYDIGSTDYGYVMVPNGIWKKLNPGKYAFAVLASVYTGPSVTLNLGPDGVFSTAPVDLLNFDYTCNLVCSGGTGSYNVNVNVNVKVEGSLLGKDEFGNPIPLTDELNGHTYIVPGMLIAYNTGGETFQFGAGKYIDSDYSDFKQVNGVEIKPIITPSLTLSWGLFTSPNTPIIGEQSLFDLNLGYENPIALDIDVQWGETPSATVNSTGDITYGAGILDTLFPSLEYQGSLQVYSYTSPNLLGGDSSQAAAVNA